MPGSYNVSPILANGQQTVTAQGQSLNDTFAAALTGLLTAAGALVDQSAAATAEIAVPIRGEGADAVSLFEDLVADLLTRVDLDGGCFAPVELDGLIKTDDGLTAWGYLHGYAETGSSSVRLPVVASPVLDTGERGVVVGLRLQLQFGPTRDRART